MKEPIKYAQIIIQICILISSITEILKMKSYKWTQYVYITCSQYQFINGLLHCEALSVLSLPIQ